MSVKTYDFIIGYENKVRELESAYLMKYELERRGYSVLVFQECDQRYDDIQEVIYHAKVLVTSAGYADKYLEDFIRRFISFDKLVNWQWEQVFNKSLEADPDSEINVHGEICRQAVQFSWGDFNVERCIKIMGLPEKNVIKTGIISMDFVKPQFREFYKSREEVLAKYNIPTTRKVAILIGAFAWAFLNEQELKDLKEYTGTDFTDIARENRRRFDVEMDWIARALKEDPNLFFIYRPHPGDEYDRMPEDVKKILDNLMNETGRFICNQDYTVRQWLKVVDKCYMGFSTTVVDAYFANVSCRMLSPKDIPIIDEGILFDGALETSTYEEFKKSLDEDIVGNPLNEDLIRGYYGEAKELAYPKIADALERVYRDDSYIIDTTELRKKITDATKKELAEKSIFKRIKLKLWKYDWFYNAYWKLVSLPIKSGYFIRQQEYKARIDRYYKGYVGSKEEIADIERRIKKCLG